MLSTVLRTLNIPSARYITQLSICEQEGRCKTTSSFPKFRGSGGRLICVGAISLNI